MLFTFPQYSRKSPEELQKIAELKCSLARNAAEWFSPITDIHSPERIEILAEIAAVASPWADAKTISPFLLYTLWAFWLDHFLDEVPQRTTDYLKAVQDAVDAGLAGVPASTRGLMPLAFHLSELCQMLSQSPAAPTVYPEFKRILRRELDASMRYFEMGKRHGQAGALPLQEDFLYEGGWTTNARSGLLAYYLALGEPLPQACCSELSLALSAGAVAIRLANDFASHARTLPEGLLTIYSFGWPKDVVIRRARDYLKFLDHHMGRAIEMGAPKRPIKAIRLTSHLTVEIYGLTDIH
jgi:hypothetical protein